MPFEQPASRFARWLLIGLVIILGLFIMRPKTENLDIGERQLLKLWLVKGANDTEPFGPKLFNESQDALYLKPIGLPFLEFEQKFLTAVVGNAAPDLVEYFGSVAQWSTRGALLPLDEFMERDGFDRSEIFDALWEEMTWGGRVFAIPTGTANEAFYWNKDHFNEIGLDPEIPPATWDDLTTYALALTKRNAKGSITRAGYIPGYWASGQAPIFLGWSVQAGANFISDDGTDVLLTEPANVEALQWEQDLVNQLGRDQLLRVRESFGYGAQHGFMSGRLSMLVQKSSFPQEIAKFAPGLNYGVARLPVPKSGKPGVVAGSVWIGIPKGAKNPEAAWEYIKFYTRRKTQIAVAEYMVENNLPGFFPANIHAAQSPAQQSRPHMNVFVESMDWAHTHAVIPLAHTVFWRAYQNAWERTMYQDDIAPLDALRTAEAEIQSSLNNQLEYSKFYEEYLSRN